jgi:hypothetical protein
VAVSERSVHPASWSQPRPAPGSSAPAQCARRHTEARHGARHAAELRPIRVAPRRPRPRPERRRVRAQASSRRPPRKPARADASSLRLGREAELSAALLRPPSAEAAQSDPLLFPPSAEATERDALLFPASDEATERDALLFPASDEATERDALLFPASDEATERDALLFPASDEATERDALLSPASGEADPSDIFLITPRSRCRRAWPRPPDALRGSRAVEAQSVACSRDEMAGHAWAGSREASAAPSAKTPSDGVEHEPKPAAREAAAWRTIPSSCGDSRRAAKQKGGRRLRPIFRNPSLFVTYSYIRKRSSLGAQRGSGGGALRPAGPDRVGRGDGGQSEATVTRVGERAQLDGRGRGSRLRGRGR